MEDKAPKKKINVDPNKRVIKVRPGDKIVWECEADTNWEKIDNVKHIPAPEKPKSTERPKSTSQHNVEIFTMAELKDAIIKAGLLERTREPKYTKGQLNRMKKPDLVKIAKSNLKGPDGLTVKHVLFQ